MIMLLLLFIVLCIYVCIIAKKKKRKENAGYCSYYIQNILNISHKILWFDVYYMYMYELIINNAKYNIKILIYY